MRCEEKQNPVGKFRQGFGLLSSALDGCFFGRGRFSGVVASDFAGRLSRRRFGRGSGGFVFSGRNSSDQAFRP